MTICCNDDKKVVLIYFKMYIYLLLLGIKKKYSLVLFCGIM